MKHGLKYLLLEIRVESRSKSKSSLILDYLTIQCYAFSVKIDIFSTSTKMMPFNACCPFLINHHNILNGRGGGLGIFCKDHGIVV